MAGSVGVVELMSWKAVVGVRKGRSARSIFLEKDTLQYKKKGRPFFFFFFSMSSMFLCVAISLPILGSDLINEGHGDANEKLDGTVIGVEGIEFLRLFDEQFLQDVQFLPDIVAESDDGLHENRGVAYVFVEGDDSLESFSIGVHLGNLVGEVILVVNCLVHLVLFHLRGLEAGRVAVRHGILVNTCVLAGWFLYYQRSLQFLFQEKRVAPLSFSFFFLVSSFIFIYIK
jgi:hypothetical protein